MKIFELIYIPSEILQAVYLEANILFTTTGNFRRFLPSGQCPSNGTWSRRPTSCLFIVDIGRGHPPLVVVDFGTRSRVRICRHRLLIVHGRRQSRKLAQWSYSRNKPLASVCWELRQSFKSPVYVLRFPVGISAPPLRWT